jgi:hypothetical protein
MRGLSEPGITDVTLVWPVLLHVIKKVNLFANHTRLAALVCHVDAPIARHLCVNVLGHDGLAQIFQRAHRLTAAHACGYANM